jgi:predicted nucleic acid-binding protein
VIVLDSSFLIGFYNERDAHHVTARELMELFLAGVWGDGLLLEYVFLEVVTVLLLRRDLTVASKVGRILLEATELEFVPCSDGFLETVKGFSTQSDSRLSFTDVAIANVAQNRASGQLLTFDQEFRKISGLRINPTQTPQQ